MSTNVRDAQEGVPGPEVFRTSHGPPATYTSLGAQSTAPERGRDFTPDLAEARHLPPLSVEPLTQRGRCVRRGIVVFVFCLRSVGARACTVKPFTRVCVGGVPTLELGDPGSLVAERVFQGGHVPTFPVGNISTYLFNISMPRGWHYRVRGSRTGAYGALSVRVRSHSTRRLHIQPSGSTHHGNR